MQRGFENCRGSTVTPPHYRWEYLGRLALWDPRMPGAGGALGRGFFLLQRTFQKASHCWDHRHWWTIDPALFIWAALPAPCLGLWSVHSESQMHAWAPATDWVGRVCWPGRAPSPRLMLSLAGPCEAAPASLTLLCAPVVRTEASGASGGSGGWVSEGLREGRWGTTGPEEGCGVVSWAGALVPGPGWPPVLGRSLPVLASSSQMWRLAAVTPPRSSGTSLSW